MVRTRTFAALVALATSACLSRSFMTGHAYRIGQNAFLAPKDPPNRADGGAHDLGPRNGPSSVVEQRIQKLDRTETRGSQYGSERNSSIPTPEEAARLVGVRPPADAPARAWKRAWVIQKRMLPILHFFDGFHPPDSKLSLACLWWKALSGNDRSSPVYDQGLAYDLLPRFSRVFVGPKLRRFFPRLHHANVEIRTAYLDKAVTELSARVRNYSNNTSIKVRLISLGAGYDVRSMKLRVRGVIDQAVELDLPQVIEAKSNILHSKRFRKRQASLVGDDNAMLPEFHEVNLNHVEQVKTTLEDL